MNRIYSLNLMTFIHVKTGIVPRFYENDNGMIYAVFPRERREEVEAAIAEYKEDSCVVNLHQFINTYKAMKEAFRGIKEIKAEREREGTLWH